MKAEITARSDGNITLVLRSENAIEQAFLAMFPQLGTVSSGVDDQLIPTRLVAHISPLGDKEPAT